MLMIHLRADVWSLMLQQKQKWPIFHVSPSAQQSSGLSSEKTLQINVPNWQKCCKCSGPETLSSLRAPLLGHSNTRPPLTSIAEALPDSRRPIDVFTDPHFCLPVLPQIQQSESVCLCLPSSAISPINISSLHSGAKNLASDWYQSSNYCPGVIY